MFDLDLKITQERLDNIEGLYNRFFKIDLLPGVKEMLFDLSRKYKLTIAAKAVTHFSRFALEKLDFIKHLEYIVLSRVGVRKPDR